MAVFAWVRELKREGIFEIATYEDLAVKAGVNQSADGIKQIMRKLSGKLKTSKGIRWRGNYP